MIFNNAFYLIEISCAIGMAIYIILIILGFLPLSDPSPDFIVDIAHSPFPLPLTFLKEVDFVLYDIKAQENCLATDLSLLSPIETCLRTACVGQLQNIGTSLVLRRFSNCNFTGFLRFVGGTANTLK